MHAIRTDLFGNTRVVRQEGVDIIVKSIRQFGVGTTVSLIVRLNPGGRTVSLAEGFHRHRAFVQEKVDFALCTVLHPDTPDIVLRMLGDGENVKNQKVVKYAVYDTLHGIRQYAVDLRDAFDHKFSGKATNQIPQNLTGADNYWLDVRDSDDPIQDLSPKSCYNLFKALPIVSAVSGGRFQQIVRVVKAMTANRAAWEILLSFNTLIGPFTMANMEEVVRVTDNWANPELQARAIPNILTKIVEMWDTVGSKLRNSKTKDENADPVPARAPTGKFLSTMSCL